MKEKHLLARSAICLVAGEEYENRIFSGSYVKLQQMRQDTDRKRTSQPGEGNDYLPVFLQ